MAAGRRRRRPGPALGHAPVAFSPNGDGTQDTLLLAARFSKSVAWQLTISGPDRRGRQPRGDRPDVALAGTAKANGQRVPDGTYTWHLVATDAWGNAPLARSGTFTIDTTPPTLIPAPPPSAATATFSPNGDGVADRWMPPTSSAAPAPSSAVVTAPMDRSFAASTANATSSGAATVAWDGRSDAGSGVADGNYTVALTARDAAGNASAPISLPVSVYRALGSVAVSTTVFYPQDNDSLAPSTRLGSP